MLEKDTIARTAEGRLMRRVGHKGADLIAPGNTFASFTAALDAGVDMIEFDVLPARPGSDKLVLAHDFSDAATRTPHTLEEGLAHFAGAAYAGIDLDVDLKLPGYEVRVIRALERHGLLDRVLVSTMEEHSLAVLRDRFPHVRTGWSVPRLRRDPLRNPLTILPAIAVLGYVRQVLPLAAAGRIRRGEIDAVMCHFRLVTASLVRAIAQAGGELYVWTVDDPLRIARLERLGVTGVISNDPRLFAGRRSSVTA